MSQVIYKILNLVNDKFYVGSTNNKKVRFRQHRKLLRGNRHHCKHLQAAWNKYGEAKFDFVVVETVADDVSLEAVEDRWLAQHVGQPYCYNSGRSARAPWRGVYGAAHPNFQRPVSEAQKIDISTTLKAFYAEDYTNHPRVGTQHTEEAKAKISASKRANPVRYWEGKARSEETKQKISEAQKGRPNPRKGLPMSEQGRANVAAAVKRGEESHFYGKRPSNADDLQKTVYALKPDGTTAEFSSLSYMRDTLGVSLGTIIRACKSGKPVSVGVMSGWTLSYEPVQAPVIPEEYAHMPRTRQLAKEQGVTRYFTGQPCNRGHLSPRSIKGACLECAREDERRKRVAPTQQAC